MRFTSTAALLSTLALTAPAAFASVEQQPYEGISRALQQAKRVAVTETDGEFTPRAFLLSQRVAQNAKVIALQDAKPASKRSKKISKNNQTL